MYLGDSMLEKVEYDPSTDTAFVYDGNGTMTVQAGSGLPMPGMDIPGIASQAVESLPEPPSQAKKLVGWGSLIFGGLAIFKDVSRIRR